MSEVSLMKVLDEDQRIVGGPVYQVGQADQQGDYCETRQDLEEAAASFARNGSHIYVAHRREIFARVLKSFVSGDKPVSLPEYDATVPPNTWFLVVKVLEATAWAQIREGYLKGYSMKGTATALEVD